MPSSEILRRVALVRTDFSKEKHFHYQGDKNRRARKKLAITSNRLILQKNTKSRCNITEDSIFKIQPRESFKFYKVFLCSVLRLLVTANVVPRPPIYFTIMMEATLSSETSIMITAIQRNIVETVFLIFTIIGALYLFKDTFQRYCLEFSSVKNEDLIFPRQHYNYKERREKR
jgi:hypothetical protein